jgi:hypothetical protein
MSLRKAFGPALLTALIPLVACAANPIVPPATSPSAERGAPPVTHEMASTPTSAASASTGQSREFTVDAINALMGNYAFPPDGPHPAGSTEFMEWLAACEAEFGFKFEVISEAGQDPYLYGPVSSAQQQLESEVRAGCMEAVINAGIFFPITTSAADASRVYAGYMRVQQCLIDNRYPTADAPSEEAFVAQWTGNPGQAWHPYDATPAGGSVTVAPGAGPLEERLILQLEIQETCPADWESIFAED